MAQKKPGNILSDIGGRVQGGAGAGAGGSGGSDSLKARNQHEDSVTISQYYIDSTRGAKPDTSIAEFTRRFPIPSDHIYLGNNGSPTRSILFAPELKAKNAITKSIEYFIFSPMCKFIFHLDLNGRLEA